MAGGVNGSTGPFMIEVWEKGQTKREAVAEGRIRLKKEVLSRIKAGEIEKGDVLCVAKMAGIMAAKETPRLIPLCHPIEITGIEIGYEIGEEMIRVVSKVRAISRTGVEMEALFACSTTLLTIYDMCKPYGYGMEIYGLRLLKKSGGKGGEWRSEVEGRDTGDKR